MNGDRENMMVDRRAAQEGSGPGEAGPGHRSCAVCGQGVDGSGPALVRFGEAVCSEAHADEFVRAVRAARIQAAAAAVPADAPEAGGQGGGPATAVRDWKAVLGKALCWGAPLLALVLLLGGGPALLGAAGAALPVLVLLACPLGMYLMMRTMSGGGHRGEHGDGEPKR
ncbi:MAG: DUF2933 domain-containing protein [Candidatus Rokubacteria bacterium]|nr:DUF2933 domain-containing protein [Candidatus Rokubacteria bacterium]